MQKFSALKIKQQGIGAGILPAEEETVLRQRLNFKYFLLTYMLNTKFSLSALVTQRLLPLLLILATHSSWAADVQLSQFTDSPDPAVRGGLLVYTFNVENNAADMANGVVLTVPLPATSTYVSSTGTGCSHDGGVPGEVTCNLGDLQGTLAGGPVKTVTVTLRTTASTGVTINATASVISATTDTNPSGNNSLSQTTTIDDGADLVLTKSGLPNPVIAGGNVTWTVGVTNQGPNDSNSLTITDTLPTNMTYVSSSGTGWSCSNVDQTVTCTRVALANNMSAPIITIVGQVTGAVTGTLTNTVTGTAATADPNPNNTVTADVTVNAGADLSIGKSVSPNPVLSAQNATFTLTPRNNGPFAASTVTVSDPLPAGFAFTSASGTGWTCAHAGALTGGTVTCSRASYAVGAANDITIVATAPTVTLLTPATNTATIGSAGTADPNLGNNSGTVNFNIVPDGADLTLTKTKTPNPVAQNADMVSTLTVHNNGPQIAASGSITVTDTLNVAQEGYSHSNFTGTNWSCAFVSPVITCTYNAALASGADAPALNITTTALLAGSIVNNAAVSYSGTDWNDGNNTASGTSTSTTSPSSADLSITKTATAGGDTVLANTELSIDYSLVVLNAGPGSADGIVVTDAIQGHVSGTIVSVGTIVVSGGSTATFACTTGATVTCTQMIGGLLIVGDTVTIPVTVRRPIQDGTIKNIATVNSTTLGDPNRSNNTSNETTITVEPIADVEMQTKEVIPNSVRAGVNATYVLTFRNNGPSNALDVVVTDQMLSSIVADTAGFTFISATPSLGSCTGLDAGTSYVIGDVPTLTCTIGTLTPGHSETVTIVIRPNWQANNAVRTLNNIASITTTTRESASGGNNGNNSQVASLMVTPAEVDVLVNKTDAAPAGNDNMISYNIAIANRGPSLATGVSFIDTITPPTGKRITFVRVSDTAFGAASATTTCSNTGVTSAPGTELATTCTLEPNMPANTTVNRHLIFRVEDAPNSGGQSYSDSVTVSTNESDSNPSNNTEAETTTVRARVDLSVEKVPSIGTVQLRQPFNWNIAVTNLGPGDSLQTTRSDTLLAGMEFHGAAPSWNSTNNTPTSGTCFIAGQVLSCNFGLLENGKVVNLTIPVRMTAYPAGGSTTNCATATTSEVDPNATNNTDICSTLTVQRSSIAGVVYRDNNNDAAQLGAGETGIGSVKVRLTGTDAYGNAVSTEIETSGGGLFNFTNLSPAGVSGYTITETQPAGFFDGKETVGTSGGMAPNNGFDSIAANNQFTVIALAANTAATGYLFGELGGNTLSGNVYADTNNDGLKDGAEIGISGVTVTLTGTDFGPGGVSGGSDDTAVNVMTTTNASGVYTFSNLRAGNYTVTETQPVSHLDGKDTAGTVGGAACGTCSVTVNEVISGILITSFGTSAINMNFGELVPASISGFAYVDVNANAAKDVGETVGLPGITVTLSGTDDLGNPVPANTTTTTSGSGAYTFGNLRPGTYIVTETQPVGLDNTGAQAGTPANGTATSGATTPQVVSAITVNPGVTLTNYNFGHTGTVLSGFVYVDANGNGLMDPSEVGIQGVTVTLSGNAALGSSVCSYIASCTVMTNANGAYSFTQLPASGAGGYNLTEQAQSALPLSGYADGIDTRGTVNGIANGTTGDDVISGIALGLGQVGANYLFGEGASSLSGTVYFDTNDNGGKDSGEAGIDGITVRLTGYTWGANGADDSKTVDDVAVTGVVNTTAGGGNYSFTNLPRGTYTVTETQPADWGDGKETAGTSGGSAPNAGFTADAADNRITVIQLAAGANATSYLFGERSASLSGRVCQDTNDDGVCQAGETGVAGVTITLTGTTTASNINICTFIAPALCTARTATDGSYSFANLPAGTYTLTETHPVIYLDGKENPGGGSLGGAVDNSGFDNTAAHNRIATITVLGGKSGTNYDFGEKPLTNATVSGHVWLDSDHDRILDVVETVYAGWTVQLVRDGTVIQSATTDNLGHYTMSVVPNTDYDIRFVHPNALVVFGRAVPNERAATYVVSTASAANPAGADNTNGILSGLTIISGANIPEQSLPLDPSGVVYHSITRVPVQGAIVRISGPGAFNPATHLLGGVANASQTTGSDGFYQFLLLPSAPNGIYTLAVTAPAGLLPSPSVLIQPCANVLGVVAVPEPALVQNSNNAPVVGSDAHNPAACPVTSNGLAATANSTQYYFQFDLTNGVSANVIHNHIPLDPILGGAIRVTKTTPLVNVSRGDLVPYTITATNTLSAVLSNIDIRDQVPPGFKYKSGTASVDGVAKEPTVSGRNLTWANQTFAVGQKHVFRLMLVVGSGVADGEYVNRAFALNNVANAQVSNTATATVRVVPDPTFDCSDLIGKVFDDKNANGYQDAGETGIANVRLATVNGLLVTTDDQGRFHITCAEVPNEFRGSNFVMKLDERTLPSGYRVTTENPRDVRMTRGKMSKLNFGAAIHRVFRVELSRAAFKGNTSEMTDSLAKAVAALPEKLRGQVSVVRLAYDASAEDEKLVRSRLKQVRTTLEKLWKKSGCCYALSFEEEIFERQANKKGGVK
jgi:uncharacterized repeat protein (TIGR01451 family)